MLLKFFLTSSIVLNLTACSNDKLEVLTNENKNLNQGIEQLEMKISKIEKSVDDLQQKNDTLHETVKNLSESQTLKIEKEGLFIHSKFLLPSVISTKTIIEILGKPESSRDYMNEAVGQQEIELNYGSSNFTFRIVEGQEYLRGITIYRSDILTERGITIGSHSGEVEYEYGIPSIKNNSEYSYEGKTGIRFLLKNDKVSEIGIWYLYE